MGLGILWIVILSIIFPLIESEYAKRALGIFSFICVLIAMFLSNH